MDVYFRDTYGNRVGYTNGENIRNNSGNQVGYINGNEIKDSCGNRIGCINGNDFKDTYGNRVGFINGSDIKDTYGNRVGYAEGSASNIEMCAAGLLLLNLRAGEANYETRANTMPERKIPSGCLGWFGAYIYLLTRNWGGRIGLIAGVVMLIIDHIANGGFSMPLGNYLLFTLFLATIGGIIGAIVKFFIRLANK